MQFHRIYRLQSFPHSPLILHLFALNDGDPRPGGTRISLLVQLFSKLFVLTRLRETAFGHHINIGNLKTTIAAPDLTRQKQSKTRSKIRFMHSVLTPDATHPNNLQHLALTSAITNISTFLVTICLSWAHGQSIILQLFPTQTSFGNFPESSC